MMLERISRDRYFKEAPASAVRWLRRAHGAYADIAFDEICNLRLLAYPSVDRSAFGGLSGRLLEISTVRQTKEFMHRELVPRARRNELALLVLRGAEAWGFQPAGDNVVDGSLFVSKPVRGVSLTPTSRVAHIIDGFLGIPASEIARSIGENGPPQPLSSAPVMVPIAGESNVGPDLPPRPLLRGECTSDQVELIMDRTPGARVRKLRPDSCTFAMARRDSYIGGPRYRIFDFLDGEPTLLEAVEFGNRHGMTLRGSMAYWDILEALRQGFIEIR